jgi:hypothetical protein
MLSHEDKRSSSPRLFLSITHTSQLIHHLLHRVIAARSDESWQTFDAADHVNCAAAMEGRHGAHMTMENQSPFLRPRRK